MNIRRFVTILALVSALSIGTFGQAVTGRITGIAVDPSQPRMSEISYFVDVPGVTVWNIVSAIRWGI